MDTGRDTAAEPAAAAEAGPNAEATMHDSKPPARMPAAREDHHVSKRTTRRNRILDSENTTTDAASFHNLNGLRPNPPNGHMNRTLTYWFPGRPRDSGARVGAFPPRTVVEHSLDIG
jgi:hypothetical protein